MQTGGRTVHRRALLGAALALSGALRPAWAQPGPVSLGALYPFSGILALLGDESYRGLELAIEERNAAGGLLGHPLKLLKGDAADPAAAVLEVKRLLATEKVGAVFGTTAGPLVFAASQVTELAGEPYFELGAIADPVTERGFHTLFRSCPEASAFAALGVDAVTANLAPMWDVATAALRVGILHEDGLYGSTVSSFQVARCREQGLNVVEKLAYSAATTDLGSVVQRLRGANAGVVFHTGYPNDVVLFYRQMKQAGWFPRMVIGAGGGYSLTDTATAIGPEFEGTVNIDFPPFQTDPAAAPGVREVEAAYQRKYGSKPRSGHSLANYVGAKLFLDAITRAASLDKEKLRGAVLATDVSPGSTANSWGAKFDDRGQNVLARPFLTQWQGGQERTVSPEKAAVAALRPKLGP